MSPKLIYRVAIKNVYTNSSKIYDISGPVSNVVHTINSHFGCEFISTAGVTNVITRPAVVSQRFKCLDITRYQTETKKFRGGMGSKHESIGKIEGLVSDQLKKNAICDEKTQFAFIKNF